MWNNIGNLLGRRRLPLFPLIVINLLVITYFSSTRFDKESSIHELCPFYSGLSTNEQILQIMSDQNLGIESKTFFLETSLTGNMSLRLLLGIEAAARNLQDLRNLTVYVITEVGGTFKKSEVMVTLEKRYHNIKFMEVDLDKLVIGTPLEEWYTSGIVKTSKYKVNHISDALRLLFLWLYGGLYMDLDIVLHKWVTFTNNSVMRWDTNKLCNGVLAFAARHPFVSSSLEILAKNYKPDSWDANGPDIINKMYSDYAKKNDCDVVTLPTSMFMPLNWDEVALNWYFAEKRTQQSLDKIKNSSGIHFSNSYFNNSIPLNYTSAFSVIAKSNCPIVWAEAEKIGWI